MEVDFDKDDKALFEELNKFAKENAQQYIDVCVAWKPKFEQLLAMLSQAQEQLTELSKMEQDFPKHTKIHSFYTTLHTGRRSEDVKAIFSAISDLKREIRGKIENLYYYRGTI